MEIKPLYKLQYIILLIFSCYSLNSQNIFAKLEKQKYDDIKKTAWRNIERNNSVFYWYFFLAKICSDNNFAGFDIDKANDLLKITEKKIIDIENNEKLFKKHNYLLNLDSIKNLRFQINSTKYEQLLSDRSNNWEDWEYFIKEYQLRISTNFYSEAEKFIFLKYTYKGRMNLKSFYYNFFGSIYRDTAKFKYNKHVFDKINTLKTSKNAFNYYIKTLKTDTFCYDSTISLLKHKYDFLIVCEFSEISSIERLDSAFDVVYSRNFASNDALIKINNISKLFIADVFNNAEKLKNQLNLYKQLSSKKYFKFIQDTLIQLHLKKLKICCNYLNLSQLNNLYKEYRFTRDFNINTTQIFARRLGQLIKAEFNNKCTVGEKINFLQYDVTEYSLLASEVVDTLISRLNKHIYQSVIYESDPVVRFELLDKWENSFICDIDLYYKSIKHTNIYIENSFFSEEKTAIIRNIKIKDIDYSKLNNNKDTQEAQTINKKGNTQKHLIF
ncbi:MAG: hypothetical protein K8R54_15750 [Bacteroidales bacterium]|nr:hypothetical protein [Bacteroidales bacterium]